MAIRDSRTENWTHEFDETDLVSNMLSVAVLRDDLAIATTDTFETDKTITFGIASRDGSQTLAVDLPAIYLEEEGHLLVRFGARKDNGEHVLAIGPIKPIRMLPEWGISDNLPEYVPLPDDLCRNVQIEIPIEGSGEDA